MRRAGSPSPHTKLQLLLLDLHRLAGVKVLLLLLVLFLET